MNQQSHIIPLTNGFETVNGFEMYYELYGAGNPLVLIHGGGSSGYFDFEETIRRLSDSFLLIVPDLQNHGRSGHRLQPETFEQDADDVIGLLTILGISKASFFGFSNGATTALKIACKYPHRTEKVIAASGLTRRKGMIDGFFEMMADHTIETMPLYLKERFLQLNPDPDLLQDMFEKDSQRMLAFQDWEDSQLRSIDAPVLLMCGDRDVVKVAHQEEMKHLIPGAGLLVLPSGHGEFMMRDEHGNADAPLIDSTINQVKKFLDQEKP